MFDFTVQVIAALAATCLALPSGRTRHEYYTNATLLSTPDVFRPIRLNGIPIGTKELQPYSVNGTVHLLTDGRRFGHDDWVLPGRNGISWEYRPDSKHGWANRASPTQGFYNFVGSGGFVHTITCTADDAGFVAQNFDHGAFSQSSLESEYLNESRGHFTIEFASDIVESATDIFEGDLTNIFFNALEIFA
ncbi:uncharacterized protein Triagg1_8335 [Trichoderma aggressivum f. europaeum]|uniref:Uncharacterized protein n=1 Tax=Trichoderma aggressivum f. europaeum TaxID=173218 RepID=A0AAE1J0W9_9HYPO|nr:hypothetical protein Triagg1_8335 [Trichoderma aggressivum f. europaeum]